MIRAFALALLLGIVTTATAEAQQMPASMTYAPNYTTYSTQTTGGGGGFLNALKSFFGISTSPTMTYVGVPTVWRQVPQPISKKWLQDHGISPTYPRRFYQYPTSSGGSANSNQGSGQGSGHHDSSDG